jgi:hypothetical protein
LALDGDGRRPTDDLLDAPHARKALDMNVNKTDAYDAEELAHLVRADW